MLVSFAVTHAARLPVAQWTSADGLPGDGVAAVTSDRDGFLWLGTDGGLSRFDGHDWTFWTALDSPLGEGVRQVLPTSGGDLWVAAEGGLFFLAAGSTADAAFLRVSDLPFSALVERADGTVWVGGDHLYRVEATAPPMLATVEVAYPQGISRWPRVVDLAESPSGELWLATTAGLVRIGADGTQTSASVAPDGRNDSVLWIDAAPDGRIWFARGERVYVLSGPLDELLQVPLVERAVPLGSPDPAAGAGRVEFIDRRHGLRSAPTHRSAGRDPSGRLWFGTTEGLVRLEGQAVHTYGRAEGLPGSAVIAVHADRWGNVWCGTFTAGLLRVVPDGFVTFGADEGLTQSMVVAITEVDGELLVATRPKPLTLHRRVGERFEAIRPRQPATRTNDWGWGQIVERDRRGAWWLPSSEGLLRYDGARAPQHLDGRNPSAVYGVEQGLGDPEVFRTFLDSQGELWIGTFGERALSRIRSDGAVETFPESSGWPASAPTGFVESPDGTLWIGLYVGGLARWDGARFEVFGPAQGLPEAFVHDLYRDAAGSLWVATEGAGLVRITGSDPSTWEMRRFTVADGLSSNNTLAIVEDLEGHLWIGHPGGVDRLDPRSGRVVSFGIADGLAGSFVHLIRRDAAGDLWFGTRSGLSRLTPTATRPPPTPEVRIGAVRIDGEPLPLPANGARRVAGLRLGPGAHRLGIDFLSIDFAPGGPARFETRLVGLDDRWRPLASRNVDLAALGPGRYRFEVRPAGGESPAMVEVEIPRPVWQRPWFLALVGSVLSLAGWGAHRWRLLRAVGVERMRTRIATDLHDDLGTSLSRIAILSEVARRQARTADPAGDDAILGEIGDTARQLVDAAGDIVWSIDPEHDSLEGLVVRLRKFASGMLEGRGAALDFEVRAEPSRRLQQGVRRQLHLVLKEALTNAARHAGASRVRLRVGMVGGQVWGEVEDDGRGFDPATSRGGSGLRNMARRAEALGGRLTVTSAPGAGTRIRVELPSSPATA